ncbi:hypothetical protein [Sphingobacterium populi]|uniref:Right-handed parallel beta-helix repeat-containing protein n=2 Tax=Sphingobacterium TaxID=28453 RepID=A0ABW5UBY8_9SPHI
MAIAVQKYKSDAEELNQLISVAVKNQTPVNLERGRTYKVDKAIQKVVLSAGQKLTINGNGSKIDFLANSGKQLSYLFHIQSKEYNAKAVFSINNVTIDGSQNPVQFDSKSYSKLILAVPIFTERIGEVNLDAINMSNIYGAGARINVFGKFSANNLKFNRVGGKWYKTDDFDAFGDAIYLAYARDNAVAIIKNSHLEGYPASPNLGGWKENLSRCGIVAEYNKTNLLTLTVENTEMVGYHRSIHIEESKTALDVNNSTFERFGSAVFVYGFAAKDVYIKNSKFINNVDSFFGGAKGIVTAYANNNKGFVTNCKIQSNTFFRNNEITVVYKNSDFQFTKYSKPNRSSSFENCNFSTTANLASDFGKMDAHSKRSSTMKHNIIKGVIDAIFK